MDQDLEAKVGQRLEDSEKNLGWKIALGVGGKGWGGGQWSALTTPTCYSVSFSCMGTLGGGRGAGPCCHCRLVHCSLCGAPNSAWHTAGPQHGNRVSVCVNERPPWVCVSTQ